MSNTYPITWDNDGERRYELGCDHGVLYVKSETPVIYTKSTLAVAQQSGTGTATTPFTNGVAWNGLTSVSENPSGADANDLWADNMKYASLRSAESFGATIEAYMYPNEFLPCDGCKNVNGVIVGQQKRQPFGFAYRSDVGSDSDVAVDKDTDYKLHLIYNATASPSSKQYSTINENPDAITFSWEISTVPIPVGAIGGHAYRPVAHLVIDSTAADATKLATLTSVLYGNNSQAPYLPMPEDIINFFNAT